MSKALQQDIPVFFDSVDKVTIVPGEQVRIDSHFGTEYIDYTDAQKSLGGIVNHPIRVIPGYKIVGLGPGILMRDGCAEVTEDAVVTDVIEDVPTRSEYIILD